MIVNELSTTGARSALDLVDDPDDREVIEGDLATLP